jgi:hypothetical protein
MLRGESSRDALAEKWLLNWEEMQEEVKQAQRRSYERLRERRIAEALRAGIEHLTLPLPGGGAEQISLRVH